ncbi:MAG: hypothetical protein IJ779_03565 [Ruminococcus sp.]|nr:hypothetical protein [Ruminococcus sp.]
MIEFKINKGKIEADVNGERGIIIKELVMAYTHLVDIMSQVSGAADGTGVDLHVAAGQPCYQSGYSGNER